MALNIYVDIDQTIARTPEGKYDLAVPIPERIQMINRLYDEGNNIIYWTGRGTVTGIDWTRLTKAQLDSWGVKYHQLLMGKPAFDIFIDDKAFNSNTFFKKIDEDMKQLAMV